MGKLQTSSEDCERERESWLLHSFEPDGLRLGHALDEPPRPREQIPSHERHRLALPLDRLLLPATLLSTQQILPTEASRILPTTPTAVSLFWLLGSRLSSSHGLDLFWNGGGIKRPSWPNPRPNPLLFTPPFIIILLHFFWITPPLIKHYVTIGYSFSGGIAYYLLQMWWRLL